MFRALAKQLHGAIEIRVIACVVFIRTDATNVV
jgi:hypothetical protein